MRRAMPRQLREIRIKCAEVADQMIGTVPRGVRGTAVIEKIRRSGMSPFVTDRLLELHNMREDSGLRRRATLGRLRERVESAEREAADLRETYRMTRQVAEGAKVPMTVEAGSYKMPTPPERRRGDIGTQLAGFTDRSVGREPIDPENVARGHTGIGRKGTDSMHDHKAGTQDDFGDTGMTEDEDADTDGSAPKRRRYMLRDDETSETHDPVGELAALHSIKAALDDAVEVFAGDEDDSEIHGKLEIMASDVEELISSLGDSEASEDEDGEDERQEERRSLRPTRGDESEMYAAEDEFGPDVSDRDLVRGGPLMDPTGKIEDEDEAAAVTSHGALTRAGATEFEDILGLRKARMTGVRASFREADRVIRQFEYRYGPQAPVAGDLRVAVAHELRKGEIRTEDLLEELRIGARASHTVL